MKLSNDRAFKANFPMTGARDLLCRALGQQVFGWN